MDTSSEMGDMARKLRQSEDGKEMIPGVHFRQYLPTSSKVWLTEEREELLMLGVWLSLSLSRFSMIW